MEFQIDGNVALVTASSSGLGRASAKALAREGADVVVNGRDPDRLESAVGAVDAAGPGDVVGHQGDITNADVCAELVDRAVEAFGGLDHLVTSTGGPTPLQPLDADDEDWYHAYDLLVMSVVRTVRAAAPHLQEGDGGTIVTIASRSVKEASPGNVLSSAVRLGVIGFEKTLSKDLGPDVRANAILPSSIETSRLEDTIGAAVDRGEVSDYDAGVERRTENIPLSRLGDPMELGGLVTYLSSPESGFVNGQAITIDGGSGASTL